MGYSRKNPHTPDGWDSGNSRGRGGQRPWKSRREEGLNWKKSSAGVNEDDYVDVPTLMLKITNGLFQKKSTPPRRMGFWKFSREGGAKTLEIQAGGGVELEKVFCRGHFNR